MIIINPKTVIPLLAVLYAFGFIPSLFAQNISAAPGKSISDFLTPDGRFDLEKARISGFQGSLNMDGFVSGIDPATGQPVFHTAAKAAAGGNPGNPDDVYWDNSMSSSILGVNGYVYALAVYNNSLIAGGWFTIAGGVRANRIAAWDGVSWSNLGGGIASHPGEGDPYVRALTVYNGTLIVGGHFSSADTISAHSIAAWNGISWTNLGSGLHHPYGSSIYSLTVYNGKLIAGGCFATAGGISANNIAVWDGVTWSGLGSGMDSPNYVLIFALTVYNGKLIAGGHFSSAGGIPVSEIAAWDGVTWNGLGSGMDGRIRALTVYDGKLIAGGEFTTAGGNSARHIAAWDGSSWTNLGSGTKGIVLSLTVFNEKLIVGRSGEVGASSIAAWDGSYWSSVFSENSSINSFTVFNGKLISGFNAGNFLAEWDGSSSNYRSSDVHYYSYGDSDDALTVYNEKLIAGGTSKWDGSSWSDFGPSMNYPKAFYDFTLYEGTLFAGGSGIVPGHGYSIGKWDGSSWISIGSDVGWKYAWETPTLISSINALTVYDNKLIVGGGFNIAGGVSANFIAAWDGSMWTSMGSGTNNMVRALTVFGGKLIAGGEFTTAGGVSAKYIAAWNGSSWANLGSGMDGAVYDLTVFDGKLVAGGDFVTAGGASSNHIAMWDGSSWENLGLGINDHVLALTVYDGKLVAGGFFTTAGGISANNIAAWDGSSWENLGSGVNSWVFALTIYNGKLIIGGHFTLAGGKVAPFIAAWTKKSTDAVSEHSPLPSTLHLSPAFPNPFNPSTTIDFSIPADSRVVVKIYNLAGQEVATLQDRKVPAGRHSVTWEAKGMPSGVYVISVKTGAFTETRKMTLLK